MVKVGISDIHFKADSAPLVRVLGSLVLTEFEPFPPKAIEELAHSLMSPAQKARFEQEQELDMSYAVDGLSRFRVNVYRQRGTLALTLRVVPLQIKSFEELRLPVEPLRKLCAEPRGLILIAGITGSGKTTTLNSMIDHINANARVQIVTVEDPIEYYHHDKKASIVQREVGLDTQSFHNALKYALRQDPDVVVIGEMRDPETIAAALTAAETGHLVLSTIHTLDAVHTLERIVSSFSPHQQPQVRARLAGVLKGVVGQRLMTTADGKERIPVTEILTGTSLVRKRIAEGKDDEIYQAMEGGAFYKMHTFDQDFARLVQEKKISLEEALENATNPEDMSLKVKGIGSASAG